MKITKKNADMLVIKSRGKIWFSGLLFVVIGLLCFAALSGEEALSCDRSEEGGQCTLERSRLWGDSVYEFALEKFEGAELGVSRSRDRDQEDTYRVELLVDGRSIPVTGYYSSDSSSKSQMIWEIDAFLRDADAARLEIHQDGGVLGLVFGGIFVLVGLLITFGIFQWSRFRFSLSENLFSLRTIGLIGTRFESIALDEIATVEFRGFSGKKGRVVAVTKRGRVIPFSRSCPSGPSTEAVVEAIREFLDRRPKPMPEPSAREDDLSKPSPVDESFESDALW